MFPPGRARLATSPALNRSPAPIKTMGIVAVTCLAAQLASARHINDVYRDGPAPLQERGADRPCPRHTVFDRDSFPVHVAKLMQISPKYLDAGGNAAGNGNIETRSEEFSSAAAPRLSLQEQATPLQQGLMAPQPSSLRTSFRALCITRIEIKESVIYTRKATGIS